jgi:hypothetical protein
MSKFTSDLELRLLTDAAGNILRNRDGRPLYTLLADLVYQSDFAKQTLTALAGFITDLESCPRFPPMSYAMFGEMTQRGAVIHDMIYNTGCLPRDMADNVLKEASVVDGASWWQANGIYAGVRVGGASHYGPATYRP